MSASSRDDHVLFSTENVLNNPKFEKIRHFLWSVLSTNESEKEIVSYRFHYPKEIFHTTSRGHKMAAEEISYLRTKDALELSFYIVQQFVTLLSKSKSNDKPEELNVLATMAKEKLEISKAWGMNPAQLHEEILPLLMSLEEMLPRIDRDKLGVGPRISFDRYVAVIRGVTLNAHFHALRKDCMEKILSEDTALKQVVQHPILERKNTHYGKADALRMFGDIKNAQAIRLALSTIRDMYAIVKQDARRQDTINGLIMLESVLSNALLREDMPFKEQLKEYRLNSALITADLGKLKEAVQMIQPCEDIKNLCLELSLYLCGVYYYAYQRKTTPKNSAYQIDNQELMDATKGTLSKINLAHYFEEASLAISDLYRNRKLQVFDQSVTVHAARNGSV